MIYAILLSLHSFGRWGVLLALVVTLYRGITGWKLNHPFTPLDNRLRNLTLIICHLQLLLGLTLYSISPLVRQFLGDVGIGLHLREVRFFGLEHIFVMILAITLITIGSVKVKRRESDREKFRTMTIWFAIGLLLILSSIPWSFSPLTSRPLIRFW